MDYAYMTHILRVLRRRNLDLDSFATVKDFEDSRNDLYDQVSSSWRSLTSKQKEYVEDTAYDLGLLTDFEDLSTWKVSNPVLLKTAVKSYLDGDYVEALKLMRRVEGGENRMIRQGFLLALWDKLGTLGLASEWDQVCRSGGLNPNRLRLEFHAAKFHLT